MVKEYFSRFKVKIVKFFDITIAKSSIQGFSQTSELYSN